MNTFNMDADPREEQLPDWARELIASLRRESTVAIKAIAAMLTAPQQKTTATSSDVFVFATPGGPVTATLGIMGVYLNSTTGITIRAMSSNGICVTASQE